MNASQETFRILFVCMGNICRSPAAECVMRHLVDRDEAASSLEIQCDSAGTIDCHAGSPPDSRMRSAGSGRGIPIHGRARQVKRDDFEKFDLIVAMDDENLMELEELAAASQGGAELRLFCEFCTSHEDHIVPDPYYGGDAGFEHVLDLLEDGCANLLARLRKNLQAPH